MNYGKVVLIVIACIALIGIVFNYKINNHNNVDASIKQISSVDLINFMSENPSYQYIDVRELDEVLDSFVEGFSNIPLENIEKGNFALNKDIPVVVLCRSGNRSMDAARILIKDGYKVYNVEDGILGME
ncbi:MAG: rhodanese-like domain-containing protein [Bacilli bacterium]